MGGLTCHHKCKCETFLHCLSMNLVGQCGKTHILFVLILHREHTNKTYIYVNKKVLNKCAQIVYSQ